MELPVHTDMSNETPWSEVPAFGLINCQLGQVRKLINEQLTTAAKTEDIKPLLDYVSSHAGKMIRPGLVLLSYLAICDTSCEKEKKNSCISRIDDMPHETIRVGAIVEMVHNASLLHDDVIDEGQKRRGLPTVNSLWGNESAVLLGDLLLSRVFKMCIHLQPKIADNIVDIAARTCEGEMRQMSLRKQGGQLSEAEYIEVITEKSAAFFGGCCRLGGLLAEATEAQIESLAGFGMNAGIAFQITDDLLDITGDENQTGKTAGSDVGKNKLTLAVIHLLRTVEERGKSAVMNSLSVGQKASYDTQYSRETLVEMLRAHGSLEYAHGTAQGFAAKAVERLSGLAESDAKEALFKTAQFMAGRQA